MNDKNAWGGGKIDVSCRTRDLGPPSGMSDTADENGWGDSIAVRVREREREQDTKRDGINRHVRASVLHTHFFLISLLLVRSSTTTIPCMISCIVTAFLPRYVCVCACVRVCVSHSYPSADIPQPPLPFPPTPPRQVGICVSVPFLSLYKLILPPGRGWREGISLSSFL